MRRFDNRYRWRVILLVSLLVAMFPALARTQSSPEAIGTPRATPAAAGAPRYPDLVAQPPDDLYFSTELLADGREHNLLRFSTTTVNAGEGPLELTGDADAESGEMVTQLVYDDVAGGNVVATWPLAIDLILHPEHHHFHLDHFAAYELLRDENGTLVPSGTGGKQSSCVLDSERVDDSGPDRKQYADCELDRQGLSVGWGDTYSASLPDQWIDLGAGFLADGAYVVRYIVDPLDQIREDGRDANNSAETRFTVRDGVIVDRPEPARCALVGEDHGPPGTVITISCSHFAEGPAMIFWGAWDPWAIDPQPIQHFTSQGTSPAQTTITLPAVEPGGYMVSVVAVNAERTGYDSATVIVGVDPVPGATPGASPVATPS